MADQGTVITEEKTLNIPAEVEEKFSELVTLIKNSKSMNTEERQYWVDVLPIMSEDQIGNLRGILDNEKNQLAKADEAYAKGVENEAGKAKKAFDQKAYEEKKAARLALEKKHEAEEEASEAAILAEIENL